ncbi:hypothetical protein [Yinghuangia sp. YIM S09857]|uniref:hypothetical protein n=1 Tax=Yinghuangia sp. YIM S09857 TaxID=3436929 RepID=UPI003F5339C2
MIRSRHHKHAVEESAGPISRDRDHGGQGASSEESALPAEARADVAGSGYPGSNPAEKYAAARDERRRATDGSPALDRAVGRDDVEGADDSGPKASDPEASDGQAPGSADTETRELLTDQPPPNRRTAP